MCFHHDFLSFFDQENCSYEISNKPCTLYSNATDEELSDEREKIRQDFCNPNFDDDYQEECHTTLGRFDREMSKRAWGNEEPQAPSIHREHGWHLPNNDD